MATDGSVRPSVAISCAHLGRDLQPPNIGAEAAVPHLLREDNHRARRRLQAADGDLRARQGYECRKAAVGAWAVCVGELWHEFEQQQQSQTDTLRKQAERLNFVARATYAFGQLGCGLLVRAVSGLDDGSKGVGVAAVAGVGAGHYPQLRQPAKAHASSVRRIARATRNVNPF